MKKLIGKRYFKIILALLGVVLLTALIELCFQIKTIRLSSSEKGIRSIDISDCIITDDVKNDNGTLSLKAGKSGTISFAVNGYVNRLAVNYDSEGYFSEKVTIGYKNIYGKEEEKTITDDNPSYLDASVIDIKKYVTSITITIPEQGYDVAITGFSIKNTVLINWLRITFFILGLSAIAMLIVFHDVIGKKLHIGFAIVAGTLGLSMVLVMPLVRVGYDEETHFRNSFVLSFESSTTQNSTLWDMLNCSDANHPAYRTGSYEEYKEFYKYLNDNALYTNNNTDDSGDEFRNTLRTTSGMQTFSYMIMALFINIFRLCKMSFGNIYIFTRLINLITYVLTMTFAIKILKKGKMVLATIGLLPTAMFLASSVSYDPIVTGFSSLGLAFILNGIYDNESKMSWKNFILGCLFLGYGISAKAVYAPLFLIGLLIPKEHFKDRKTKNIMKIGYVICFAALLLTAMMPTLLGQDSGDTRGGDTSHIGQLSYMMSNLIGYFGLLFKTIGSHLLTFSIGQEAIDNLYFFGMGRFVILIDVLLGIVVFTQGEDGFNFKGKQKAIIGVSVLMAVILVWTALYMAFTEPGVTTDIYGVQGRYFIPLLFTGSLLLPTAKVKCEWNKATFSTTIFVMMSFILGFEIYTQIIMNSCV